MKKLILLSGSPCVGKTTVGQYLFEQYENSAYLDGDWCWCVNPFSVKDKRLRNGDKSMSFVLSNYLTSEFDYVFFTSVVLTDIKIREAILKDITATNYEVIGFTLTCSEETLTKRHSKRGDKGTPNFHWLHLPPYPTDIVIDTDNMSVTKIAQKIRFYIDGEYNI